MFSVIKVDGQLFYKKVWKGEIVEVEFCDVEIFSFKIIWVELLEIDFEVSCSKGIYICLLVYDFGIVL